MPLGGDQLQHSPSGFFSGLSEKSLHSLEHLSTCSPMAGTVQGGLGGTVLLEDEIIQPQAASSSPSLLCEHELLVSCSRCTMLAFCLPPTRLYPLGTISQNNLLLILVALVMGFYLKSRKVISSFS